ncbi:MAG: MetQ/NlpA family ABC transporter substrate-binding protein [Tissierellia bacterium]|nr:MetQ/NlpA family ABC transporter substrate-binding protein [Tissierellia bacterium]
MKRVLIMMVLVIALFITGCSNTVPAQKEETTQAAEEKTEAATTEKEETTEAEKTEATGQDKNVIRIATNGTHAKIVEEAKKHIESNTDYTVEIIVFDDVIQPNIAVLESSADCNFFQHEPYLKSYAKEHNVDLAMWNDKPIYALEFGIYSDKVKSIEELKDGAQIVFGRDPSNRAIALHFLEEQGLIKLQEGVEFPELLDVIENPKNLRLTEVDITAVAHSIEDPEVDAIVIMGFSIAGAGKDPSTAIAFGSDELISRFVSVLGVKGEDKDAEWGQAVYDALTSDELNAYYEEHYKGSIRPVKK